MKKTIYIRFYAELNDFLPVSKRKKESAYSFKTPITIREALISIGIPIAEVDLILVNGNSETLKYKLRQDDRVSVYPVFESFDISTIGKIRSKALRKSKFILDCHLGKLAKYLRMLGFDTLYENNFEDEEIIKIACEQQRIILTRDKLLLKSKDITHGYYVRAIDKHEQLIEIVRKFDLYSQFKSFTRCMTCNSFLEPVKKALIIDRLDAETASNFTKFYTCRFCDKIYWKGSHFENMESYIKSLFQN